MNPGELVFIKGTQAAIVLGRGVDSTGAEDGSIIVGTFAGVEHVEQGDFGYQPGPQAENPPSYVPQGATAAGAAQTGGTFLPTAGGETAAAETSETSQAAPAADPVLDVPAATAGSTDVDFAAAQDTAGTPPFAVPEGWQAVADGHGGWDLQPTATSGS